MRLVVGVLALAVMLSPACVEDQPYTCARDSECRRGAEHGMCESTGYCSFDDTSCGEGQRRYGGLASPDLAGTCVPCIAQLVAGARHTCARTQQGELFCWGENTEGQIGNGDTGDAAVPAALTVDIQGAPLQIATALGAGSEHACAALGDALACWGDNGAGELGNPDLVTAQRRPRSVVDGGGGPVSATSVAGGLAHSCAVDRERNLSCWGDNRSSQLGVSMAVLVSTPVPQLVLGDVVAPVIGHDAYHSCALRDDASLWCWGGNDDGQVGNGTLANVPEPVPIIVEDPVRAAAIGNETSCAVTVAGELRCWGSNTDGQLGDGTTTNHAQPTPVAGLSDVRAVAVGGAHVCALRSDHGLWCWGRGSDGQLGAGSTGSTQPLQVRAGVAAVATGAAHTCILELDGSVRCFGANASAQLGIGNTVPTADPALVSLSCR